MEPSAKYQLNQADVIKWANNALIFAAPALLVFFTQIQAGSSIEEALIALKVWGLNTMVDLLRKFIAGK